MAKQENVTLPAAAAANPAAQVSYQLTKKGQQARPGVGANNNAASWQGAVAVLANGPATGLDLMQAIANANPTNVGNAVGLPAYYVRLGWLAPVA